MLKSPCTGHKAELYNATGFFGPSASRISLDVIYIPKQPTQVNSTAAFSYSYLCVKLTLSQCTEQKYSQCIRWCLSVFRVGAKKEGLEYNIEGLHIFRTQRRACGTGVGVVSLCLHSRKTSLQIYTGKNVVFIGDPSTPDCWKRRLLSQQEETFHNMLKGKRVLT